MTPADRIRAKIRARAEDYRRGLYVLLVDEAGRWVAIVRRSLIRVDNPDQHR